MRIVRNIIGILIVGASFIVLVAFVEDEFLYEYISGLSSPIEEWLNIFRFWANLGIGVALGASLLWYILGQWIFNMNYWENSNKRFIWMLLFLFPIISFILGIVFTPIPEEGRLWPYVFYVVNPLLVYYLTTLLWSPSSFKYIPVGAKAIRYW